MFTIKWRPSEGRGEYEYIHSSDTVRGKIIEIQVPVLGVRIASDARPMVRNGKPRFRRDNPNERSTLNVPPLVAAVCGLPAPRRSDLDGEAIAVLSDKGYVVSSIACEVVEETSARLVIEPKVFTPLHGEAIDLTARVQQLVGARETSPAVAVLLRDVERGVNSSTLALLGSEAYAALPLDATAGSVDLTTIVEEAEGGDDEFLDYAGEEGRERMRQHRAKERNRRVVEVAKDNFKRRYGKLFCECCGLEAQQMYGSAAVDLIDVHHRLPLESISGVVSTRPQDLAMLCPNCHRATHRTESCSLEEIRTLLVAGHRVVDPSNLSLLAGPR